MRLMIAILIHNILITTRVANLICLIIIFLDLCHSPRLFHDATVVSFAISYGLCPGVCHGCRNTFGSFHCDKLGRSRCQVEHAAGACNHS